MLVLWLLRGNFSEGCSGIVVASCAPMVATGLRLVPQATPTPPYLAIVAIGAAVVALTKVKPVWVIVVAAAIGLIVR